MEAITESGGTFKIPRRSDPSADGPAVCLACGRQFRRVITSLLATASRPVGDPLSFYGVAATVIPVLFLSVVYEARTLEQFAGDARYFGSAAAALIAGSGEVAAFQVLASRQPTRATQHAISAVLLVLGLIILAQPLHTACGPLDRRADFRAARARGSVSSVQRVLRRLPRFRLANAVVVLTLGLGLYGTLRIYDVI
jgi:hypothetical protein